MDAPVPGTTSATVAAVESIKNTLVGSVTISTAKAPRRCVQRTDIIVGLADLEFTDCGGPSMIRRALRQARHGGGDLVLTPSPKSVVTPRNVSQIPFLQRSSWIHFSRSIFSASVKLRKGLARKGDSGRLVWRGLRRFYPQMLADLVTAAEKQAGASRSPEASG